MLITQSEARAAGWNRDIAPSILKEVDVCPTFLSDDAHTVGLPPRVTQPSVGRYVREIKHYRGQATPVFLCTTVLTQLVPRASKTIPCVSPQLGSPQSIHCVKESSVKRRYPANQPRLSIRWGILDLCSGPPHHPPSHIHPRSPCPALPCLLDALLCRRGT